MATQVTQQASGTSETHAEFAQVVASLREVLGPRILTAIADNEDLSVIESWAQGDIEPPPKAAVRLKVAWEAVELLLEVEHPSVVRAFFGGMNPMLGDRPPALVLVEDPEAFMRAVREFRAYG